MSTGALLIDEEEKDNSTYEWVLENPLARELSTTSQPLLNTFGSFGNMAGSEQEKGKEGGEKGGEKSGKI